MLLASNIQYDASKNHSRHICMCAFPRIYIVVGIDCYLKIYSK